MPNCGKCGKPVGTSDVTCPHCDALLAAYASPVGSGEAEAYEAPPPPSTTDIPSVDMDVKPPSEADIVTDPTQVTEEAISTAPRPLFDTYLTVEEIAKAAEGDHSEDVVTISPDKVATKTVEFDVPDYAKPPSNAAPIPTIDEDDASVPLITRDLAPEHTPTSSPQVPAPTSNESPKRPDPEIQTLPEDDDDSEPEPESDSAGESWLYSRPQQRTSHAPPPEPEQDVLERLKARPKTESKTKAKPQAEKTSPAGETDAYLRRLHEEAGYTPPSEAAVSKPVAQGRISAEERRRNRRALQSKDDQQTAFKGNQQSASEASMSMGCSSLYVIVLAILWFSLVIAIINGNFNPTLIFFVFALTWGRKPIQKFIQQVSKQ